MARKDNSPIVVDKKIIPSSMEEAMHSSMIPYAEYVIMERALPRVEDGLKPVQRRILYTLLDLGITPDKPHKKSARIVGDCLGKYHPHGDTSVYDAMVRMAQDFNMREMLIDGHGNFGSIDGDTAAAMRYTEARLTPLSLELLRDIDKDTVPFGLNFDDSLKEPQMLPGRFPNLLVNGASGIAVAIATNIPPHNLAEVIDGTVAFIDNPGITVKEMLRFIKGPDFPTGGYLIAGEEELEKAYLTGKGKLTVRAKVDIEPSSGGKKLLVISELPYQVNKVNCLEKILKISEEKKDFLSGISDIRDESDRNGIRAVVEVRKDANAENILNYLYKYTDLQVTFGMNNMAIADGKPQLLGLVDIIKYYVDYQKQVITRRTKYDLENAQKREHILLGLMIAVDNIDAVIRTIRASKTPSEARERLMAEFSMTQIQAQAVLDLRLQRLTNIEIITLKEEYERIVAFIAELQGILKSETRLMSLIKKELLEIKKKYANPRRTKFLSETAKDDIIIEEPIIKEDVAVILKSDGHIMRLPIKLYQRTAKDAADAFEKVENVLELTTNDKLHMFTNMGNMFMLDIKNVPEAKLKDRGAPYNSLLAGFSKGEKVIKAFHISSFDEGSLLFFTKNGMVKHSLVKEFNVRKGKVAACGLKDGDCIINVEMQQQDKTILLITKQGMSINIENNIPSQGRTAQGVKGMNLSADDEVIAAFQLGEEGEVLVLTDRGYAKRSFTFDYEVQGRNGKGVKTLDFRKNGANGYEIVAAHYVCEPFEINCVQKNGEETKIFTEEVPIESRFSKGQPLIMVLMDNILVSAKRCVSV